MIIEKVILSNYQCYYDNVEINLDKGFNIMLGANGEGKTKLYEALMWLFNYKENSRKINLVSKKSLKNLRSGESLDVFVEIHVKENEKSRSKASIRKGFTVKSIGDNMNYSAVSYTGIESKLSGERIDVDGISLLGRMFPYQYRDYSNFAGEESLDILSADESLINLINLFSNAKKYQLYSSLIEKVLERAQKDVEKAATRNNKTERLLKNSNAKKDQLLQLIANDHVTSKEFITEIKKLEKKIKDIDKLVENQSLLKDLNERIIGIEEQVKTTNLSIRERYVEMIFDRSWILMHFDTILVEFNKKIDVLYSARRREADAHLIEEGKKQGIKSALLLKKTFPLAVNVPDKPTMEEMIKSEICKVCNREAPKGTEAYNFMQSKLEALKTSLAKIDDDNNKVEDLFKNEHLGGLNSIRVKQEENISKNLNTIKSDIDLRHNINEEAYSKLEELSEEKDSIIERKAELLGDSGLSESDLIGQFQNYKQWNEQLSTKNTRLQILNGKIKANSEELINVKLSIDELVGEHIDPFLMKSKQIIGQLNTLLRETKEKEFDSILTRLEKKTNEIFAKINTTAFSGSLSFNKLKRPNGEVSVSINHLTSDGSNFSDPNKSLKTSVNLALILGVSSMAEESNLATYPLIFDAPISSFDTKKSREFLNLLSQVGGQKLIMLKNFVIVDKDKVSVSDEFNDVLRDKAYLLNLIRPFDKTDLATIETKITTI